MRIGMATIQSNKCNPHKPARLFVSFRVRNSCDFVDRLSGWVPASYLI